MVVVLKKNEDQSPPEVTKVLRGGIKSSAQAIEEDAVATKPELKRISDFDNEERYVEYIARELSAKAGENLTILHVLEAMWRQELTKLLSQ